MIVPTVTVDRGGIAVVINKSDFDPAKDRVWGAIAEPAEDSKDDLIEKLAALGIKKDRRTSIETLRELLDEAS